MGAERKMLKHFLFNFAPLARRVMTNCDEALSNAVAADRKRRLEHLTYDVNPARAEYCQTGVLVMATWYSAILRPWWHEFIWPRLTTSYCSF